MFDDFDERPVDCDFVLPDYLPDIAAVLKCTMKPVVQSKQLSGDRLIADGVANLRVLYLDEARKCVRSCEFTQPFTSTFNVKNAGVGACIRLDAKPNYVNCRATSPRRLDIHGAFSVKLKVTAEGGQEVVSSARGEGVYTRPSRCTIRFRPRRRKSPSPSARCSSSGQASCRPRPSSAARRWPMSRTAR